MGERLGVVLVCVVFTIEILCLILYLNLLWRICRYEVAEMFGSKKDRNF